MNKVILMGRLTREADIRFGGNDNSLCIARFSIAVGRRFERDKADFFNIVAFGKTGEFVDKYLHKGMKVVLSGRLQNDSYTNKEGNKVNTTNIVCEEIEFAESKSAQDREQAEINEGFQTSQPVEGFQTEPGFAPVPDVAVDDTLPFA